MACNGDTFIFYDFQLVYFTLSRLEIRKKKTSEMIYGQRILAPSEIWEIKEKISSHHSVVQHLKEYNYCVSELSVM